MTPLALTEQERSKIEKIVEECIQLNKKRNDIVHEGKTVSFDDVESGISAAETLIEFIQSAKT